ncbi:MAG: carbamate kinase [Candidatus Izemoplasmataceae bacterium]
MSRYVISLGGNALGNNPEEQKALLKDVAKPIVNLIKEGHEIIIVHGNGPQVGMINLAFTEAKTTPKMPFAECGAMSQGYIGFHLQNAITNELLNQDIKKHIGAIVTQVVVDENDPLFQNPSKPVGAFYTEEEAKKLTETMGYVMKEDSGRGYRRVVPSPLPIDVVEKDMIKTLIENKHVVICAGGGGIPVIAKDNHYLGVDAVIDKDYASAKIADLVQADILVILTAVDNVYVNFGLPNQIALKEITSDELKPYLYDNQFAKGSMYPKVMACLEFLNNKNKKAVISSLSNAISAFHLNSGTIITK